MKCSVGRIDRVLRISIGLVLVLTGCGGGDSTTSAAPTTQTANLVGGIIEHVPYTCGAQSGRTGRLGQFNYIAGDSCVFTVGAMSFPVASSKIAKGYVTPYDLTNTKEQAWTLMAILDSISYGRPSTDLFVIVDSNLERRIISVNLSAGDAAVTSALDTFNSAGVTVRQVSVAAAKTRLAKTVNEDNSLVSPISLLQSQGTTVLNALRLPALSGQPWVPPSGGLGESPSGGLGESDHPNVVNLRFYDGNGNPYAVSPSIAFAPVILPYGFYDGTDIFSQYVTPNQNPNNSIPVWGWDSNGIAYSDIPGGMVGQAPLNVEAIMLKVGRQQSTNSGSAFKNAMFYGSTPASSPITLAAYGADPKPGTNAHFPPNLNFAFSGNLNFVSPDGNHWVTCPNLVFTQGGTTASLSAWLTVLKDLSDMTIDAADIALSDGTDVADDYKFLMSLATTALDVAKLASENWFLVGVNARTQSSGVTLNGLPGLFMTCQQTGSAAHPFWPPRPSGSTNTNWPVVIQSTYDDHTFDVHVAQPNTQLKGFNK